MSDNKFGRVEGIPEGEPCFVLRAKDDATLAMLVSYRALCSSLGSPDEHLDAITRVSARIREWREQHPELCKVPD